MGSTFDAWRPAAAAYDIDQAERTDPAPEYRAANGRSEVYANASRHVLPIGKQLEQQRIQISVKLDRLEGNWVKHHEYILTTSNSPLALSRRYSDFSILSDYLLRTYTFRLLPPLPPKRIAISGRHLSDDQFLERRARGLSRFSTAVVNHPVLSQDSLVQLFFREQSSSEHLKALASGKKQGIDDEASTTIINSQDERQVPEDFEAKLSELKDSVVAMVDAWTKICQAYERSIKRIEARATDQMKIKELADTVCDIQQGCSAFPEETRSSREELTVVSRHLASQADSSNQHVVSCIETSLERFKAHRELFSSFRDLVVRHKTYSPDNVDRLRKNVSNNGKKLENVRSEQKPNWEQNESKLVSLIEADNQQIEVLLKRRLFIRYCLWQEMQYLFSVSTLLSTSLSKFATAERVFAEITQQNFAKLENSLTQEQPDHHM